MKMATAPLPLLLLLLTLLAATASARPCKIIFYLSATTTTYYRFNSHAGNPNSPNSFLQFRNRPRYITLIYTTTTRFRDLRPSLGFNSDPTVNGDSQSSSNLLTSSGSPLKLHSTVSSSIRERSKDIMGVVGALLFGVGCGALTAATMFFLWALCSPRSFDYDDVSSDDEDTDGVASAKKKLGYVAIPSNPKLVDDDLKKPAPPAKEVV